MKGKRPRDVARRGKSGHHCPNNQCPLLTHSRHRPAFDLQGQGCFQPLSNVRLCIRPTSILRSRCASAPQYPFNEANVLHHVRRQLASQVRPVAPHRRDRVDRLPPLFCSGAVRMMLGQKPNRVSECRHYMLASITHDANRSGKWEAIGIELCRFSKGCRFDSHDVIDTGGPRSGHATPSSVVLRWRT